MSAYFDLAAFFTALVSVIRHRALSERTVAAQAGVSPSTITRMRKGNLPSVQSLVAIAGWAGLALDPFISTTEQPFPKAGDTDAD